MSIVRHKIGAERVVVKELKKGLYPEHGDVVELTKPMMVPVIERYLYQYPNLRQSPRWTEVSYRWDEAIPVGGLQQTPKAIEVRTHKPSWFTRLRWWLFNNKLPEAKVVRSE